MLGTGAAAQGDAAIQSTSPERQQRRVFVSYSRRDKAFALAVASGLPKHGIKTEIDTKDIVPGEDWQSRLEGLITESDAVVFVISPDSIRSKHCAWEVDRTLELGKTLIPLLWRKLEKEAPPAALSALQYVLFDKYGRDGSGRRQEIDSTVAKVAAALDVVEVLWAREHTKWVARAAAWDRAAPSRPVGLLLRSDDIAAADAWARLRPEGSPQVTEILFDYLEASRLKERADRDLEERFRKTRADRESRTAFLGSMSHDLRTPLNAVSGFSEMIAKEIYGPIGNRRYIEYAEDILATSTYLIQSINQILDTARIDAGRPLVSKATIDPGEAIRVATRVFEPKALHRDLKLIVDIAPLPEIFADGRALTQIVVELISNAIKGASSGGVWVRARPHRTGIIVSVIDTGNGMPDEILLRLGERFLQAEQTEVYQSGLGLGISVSRAAIEAHAGTLEFDSIEREGTIASFYLPADGGGDIRSAPALAADPTGAAVPIAVGITLLEMSREEIYGEMRRLLEAPPPAAPIDSLPIDDPTPIPIPPHRIAPAEPLANTYAPPLPASREPTMEETLASIRRIIAEDSPPEQPPAPIPELPPSTSSRTVKAAVREVGFSPADAEDASSVYEHVATVLTAMSTRIDESFELLIRRYDEVFANASRSPDVDRLAGVFDERVRDAERRSAEAIGQVGEQVARIAERLQSLQDDRFEELKQKIDREIRNLELRLGEGGRRSSGPPSVD